MATERARTAEANGMGMAGHIGKLLE